MSLVRLVAIGIALGSSLPREAAAAPSPEPGVVEFRAAATGLRKMCADGAKEVLEGTRDVVRKAVIRAEVADALDDPAPALAADLAADALEGLDKAPEKELDARVAKLGGTLPELAEIDAAIRASGDKDAKVVDTTKRKELCLDLCSSRDASGKIVAARRFDVCAFEDATLATAALRADSDSVASLLATLQQRIDELTPADPERFESLADASLMARTVDKAGAAAAAAGLGGLPVLGSQTIGAFINTAAQALAKVIVDRAKREAIAWVLDTLAAEVCSTENENHWAKQEIASHWLPNVCALAKDERASHYGAGAAQIDALRAAIRGDIGGLPGAALGLALGHLFVESALRPNRHRSRLEGAVPNVVRCHSAEGTAAATINGFDLCDDALAVRRASETAMRSIVEGGDPRLALEELGTEIDRVNVEVTASKGYLESPATQLLACALSIGSAVGDEPTKGNVLAALVDAPACWTLVGEGYVDLGTAVATGATDDRVLAIDAHVDGKQVEQLSTLVRLDRDVRRPAQRIFDASRVLAAAVKRATELQRTPGAPGVELPEPPKFDGAKKPGEAADAAADYLEQAIASQLQVDRAKHLHAIADILEAAANVASATVDLLETTNAKTVLVGLKYAEPRLTTAPAALVLEVPMPKVREDVVPILRARIATIERAAMLVRSVADHDWGHAANDGLALLADAIAELRASVGKNPRQTTTTTASGVLGDALDPLARHIGTLAAIAGAKDSDEMAEALDAAANPPGGWRSKLGKGNFTASLTAHAGVMAALEWRHGIYGATFERGKLHGQAPTLFLPFGVELAWGFSRTVLALFFPILDPAAFLGYDAAKSRLPGPSPLTVLSPGVAGRVAFGRSPFGLMLFSVFRPKYRTWEPTVNGPGAHVVQLGAAITIDVTLFRFHRKGR